MTRKLSLLAALFISAAAGCAQFMGPLQTRHLPPADAPGPDGRPYTIAEQEARGRQRYTIPDNSWAAGPSTYGGLTGPGYSTMQTETGH